MNKKYILKLLSCIIIVLFGITISTNVFARYFEIFDKKLVTAQIANPIFNVISLQKEISCQINKETKLDTYKFKITNYDQIGNISEVPFEYDIEIIESDNRFPVEYELYEIGNTENLLLNSNKTNKFSIFPNLEYEKEFELLVKWKSKEGEIGAEKNIQIVVNSEQIQNL